MTNPVRVLSLDGGGIRGVFTAAVLATVEEMTGKRLVDHFDLIAGTSTGGIIALGLGLGLPARKILEFYCEAGPRIFPTTGLTWRNLRWVFRPKHKQKVLRNSLERIMGRNLMGDSSCRLIIPAFDAATGDVHVFKTAHHDRLKQDYLTPAVEVALATAAAPTYFQVFQNTSGQRFIDGGVWANCPAAIAAVEARCILAAHEIEILSIGTTGAPFRIPKRVGRSGVLGWGKLTLEVLMNAQQAGALAQAQLLSDGQVMRVDRPVPPKLFTLDNAKAIDELHAIGLHAGRHSEKAISSRFLLAPADPFRPVHRP